MNSERDRTPSRQGRFVPQTYTAPAGEDESLDVWGFRDTRFELRPDGVVELLGERYALCGEEMVDLLAWVHETFHPDVAPDDRNEPHYPPAIPAPIHHAAFEEQVRKLLDDDQWTHDPELRLRHGHGHTQEEMYAIKYGVLPRVPDLVVFPSSHEQVVALVEAAIRHDICLIPYGGGTNVSDALRCPINEARSIVSVDMKRMGRILWIDPANHMACIEAGAVGRHLSAQLAEHGFTLGHEPDSIEFSTLGGWVATHASGMKKSRYGNIEDIVLDVTVVTPQGVLKRTSVAPRESVGISDPRRWIYGSEGAFGIVTQAVVKIFPLPEVQEYGSVVFPSFAEGVDFLYGLQRSGVRPASVRLVDNGQFQLSQMMKARKTGLAALKSRAEKFFVTRVKGFEPNHMSACTIVFEGERSNTDAEKRAVYRLAAQHGGINGGEENGRRGYQLTFGIAYIRDWIMNHWMLAESFETSVSWDQAFELCERVKQRVHDEHAARGFPGKPFITCRITQLYETGVAIYFYFATYYKGLENPSEAYAEIERAARDEVLRCGGSLSHHHGIGKIRRGFLHRIQSPGTTEWGRQIKRSVDPTNIFGSGNQSFGSD